METTQSRRTLLLAGLSGAAAAMARTKTARGADQESISNAEPPAGKGQPLPAVLKVSLAGYSFRDFLDKPGKPGKMTLFDLTELCARLGTDAVEPTFYYFLKTDDEYVYSLKRKIFLAGLDISCTPTNNNFCKPAPDVDEDVARINKWVDIAVKLGSPAIRIFAGAPVKGVSREQAFTNVVSAMKRACAYAGGHGIFLAIENHGYMTETADDVLRILDAVKSDWLGLNLDTGNFPDDAYGGIAKLAPRAVTCQVKVMLHDKGKAQPADFGRIAGILRDARYRGYLALEYEGRDPHKEVPMYIEKLKKAVRNPA